MPSRSQKEFHFSNRLCLASTSFKRGRGTAFWRRKIVNARPILGPADPKSDSHEVLGAQHPRRHFPFTRDLQLDFVRRSQRLSVQIVGDRQELHRPVLDHDAFVPEFRAAGLAQGF
jgi:hypothetical protein